MVKILQFIFEAWGNSLKKPVDDSTTTGMSWAKGFARSAWPVVGGAFSDRASLNRVRLFCPPLALHKIVFFVKAVPRHDDVPADFLALSRIIYKNFSDRQYHQ